MRTWSSAVILAAILGGCAAPQTQASAPAGSVEPSEEELRERYPAATVARITDIRDKHDLALATPTLASATALGDALLAAFRDSLHQIDALDWNAYAADAARLLGTLAPEGTPEEAANALAKRAIFQDLLGEEAGALASRRESMEHAHTYLSGLGMIWVLRSEGSAAEARALCEKTRPLARTGAEIHDLDRECSEAEARSPSAAPKRTSFTLQNACEKTVKLFYGETPEYGSGRTSSMSADSQQSETLNEGETIWLLDENGNGVSSFSASASVRHVEIASNCVSFRTR